VTAKIPDEAGKLVRFTRRTIPEALSRYQDWPQPDVSLLEAAQAERVTTWIELISAYLGGERVAQRLRERGLSYSELLRLAKRCSELGEDGAQWGWRAVIRHSCRAPYCRKQPVNGAKGSAGALHLLFKRHPQIRQNLDADICRQHKHNVPQESRIQAKTLHNKFLIECKAAGIGPLEWPFNTRYEGRRSIERYLRSVVERGGASVVAAREGDAVASRLRTGTGRDRFCLSLAPFDTAEMDPHKLHLVGVVGIPTDYGIEWIPIERMQLILIADDFSETVLGYAVAIRRECESSDILVAGQCLIEPWKPRKPVLSTMVYEEGAGLPNGVIPDLGAFGICILKVDNALVLKSRAVVDQLCGRLGCMINWGPVRHWERRALVERIFGILEQAGFQRVASTTGSHPKDPRKRNPAATAAAHRIRLDVILDLIDIVITSYNLRASEGRRGLSRLDIIRQAVAGVGAPLFVPHLPPATFRAPDLDVQKDRATIRGSAKMGRRPYIQYHRARYTNPVLAASPHLVGRKVVLHVPRDIRVLQCFLDTGEPLGAIMAQGAWAKTPHTLEDRRLSNAAMANDRIIEQHHEDPVSAMHRGLAEEAVHDHKPKRPKVSKAATTLARSVTKSGAPMPVVGSGESASQDPERPAVTTRRAPSLVPRRGGGGSRHG
jgi:hypothetical protein